MQVRIDSHPGRFTISEEVLSPLCGPQTLQVNGAFSEGKGKGITIPLQPWTGPQGFRRLRLPDFKTAGT